MSKTIIAIVIIIIMAGLGYLLCKYLNPGKSQQEMMTIKVYFGNTNLNSNIEDCDKVYPVKRSITKTLGVAKASLEELFNGPTEEEKSEGYVSWFSQETKDILKSVKIEDNTAYVNLEDIRQIVPNVSTSCGSAEFLAEVETTLKQFSTLDRVIIAIDGKPSTFYEWTQIGCVEENDFCDETPFKISDRESAENFSQIGNIVKNNPGLKKDTWYLIYEQPGSPALTIELIFDEESKCIIGEEIKSCSSVTLENGERVKIEGIEKEERVLVKTLTKQI